MIDAVCIGLWGAVTVEVRKSTTCRVAVAIYPSQTGLEHSRTYSLCVGRSGSPGNVLEPRTEVQSKCRYREGIRHVKGLGVCQNNEKRKDIRLCSYTLTDQCVLVPRTTVL